MQLHAMQSEVVMSGTGQTTRFNMDANAKAFRVLSDTLYQNKIGSMVREVSCNAYDSHIMAGIPERPFQIHLPDALEPHFSVRDFGLGLDEAGVREVFTTYFRSTKDQNNNVVGAFGLGSKTPFAYTDAFTIIAIKDGVKRTFSAFIDGDGLPSLTILNDSVTDEGNGVEIIVPVTGASDFPRFRREVQDQLTFFTVKPEVLNVAEGYEIEWMDWEGANSYMNCENVLIGGNNTSFRGVWIVQGIVGYRMDVEVVKQALSPENREFLEIISSAALLKFDLGQIEVTPSREGVSYSKYTLGNIEKLLDNARQNIKVTVQAELDAMPDAWAKALAINTRDNLRKLANVTKATFEAPGYYKSNGYYYLELERIANIDKPLTDMASDDSVDPDDDDDTDGNVVALSGLSFRAYSHEYSRRKYRWTEKGVGKHAKADASLSILVRDTSDKPVVRTREWLSNLRHGSQVFVLTNRDGTTVTEDQLAEIQARFGESFTFTMMSKVDLPPPEARANNGYKPPTAYTYNKEDDFDTARYWERETDKLDTFEEGAYYTTVDRHSLNMSNNCRVVLAMADSGLLDRPVMAIREKDVKRIADNPNWIPIESKAKEIIDEIAGNVALRNAYSLTKHYGVSVEFLDSDVVEILREAYRAGNLHKDSPLHRMFRMEHTVEKLKERAKKRGFSNVVRVAFEYCGVATADNTNEVFKTINDEVARLAELTSQRHPLLGIMHSRYTYRRGGNSYQNPSEVAEHIVSYVNATAGA